MGAAFWRPLAGTATWAAAAVVPLQAAVQGHLGGAALMVWTGAWLLFLAAFLSRYTRSARQWAHADLALVGVQSVASLVAAAASPDRFSAGILLVVVAGQLARVGRTTAALWLLAQTGLFITLLLDETAPASAVTFGVAFGGLQAFALGTAVLGERERLAREELAAIALELTATQTRLFEETRASERLRIARDLHDALGHHLTALSVQLDVATRLGAGPAAPHVEEAHALARLLLADVRAVVGEMRTEESVDLRAALVALAERARPSIAVALDLHPDALSPGRLRADVLHRFGQEVITNAIRHARATTVTLRLTSGSDGLRILGQDDGLGAAPLRWGLGLTGMRERFQALGGDVSVQTRPEGGLEVCGWLPAERVAQ